MAVIAKPDLRQALRTLLVPLIKVFCSFAAGGNASAQSPLTSRTIQNYPTGVGVIGSSARPAYPLKVGANNRYLVAGDSRAAARLSPAGSRDWSDQLSPYSRPSSVHAQRCFPAPPRKRRAHSR